MITDGKSAGIAKYTLNINQVIVRFDGQECPSFSFHFLFGKVFEESNFMGYNKNQGKE
ncbi:MAG: hypothetical protein J1D87_09015 [Lachnospiraceae bacterium]|nr:hypothetical protein [Lachnospiraceae bacterium]